MVSWKPKLKRPKQPKQLAQLQERFKALRKKSAYDLLIGDSLARYKRRMQKEKDELAREGKGLRTIAFFLTLVSMMLALSLVPFFPQPLPMLIAVLVAFMVYMMPAIGMPLGCIPVALGLLYHLATVDFIAMLGPAIVRVLFICLLIFFFVMLPVRFRRYEDAIGINIGIIAASLLFFNQTYFLAIPLLLTTAILFKKTQAGLAIAYYALISVPLMVLQYYQLILNIPRADFWNDLSAVPPIYTSLSGVLGQIQVGMTQFKMFDISQTLGRITWEVIATPPTQVHTVSQAITQYVDSFPGMIMFLAIVGGLVWVVSLVLPSITSKSGVNQAEKLFPALAAAGTTAVFFIFMSSLKHPMAFSAQIDNSKMILGILGSLVFAVPAAMLNFAPKKKAEIEKNCQTILVKAGDLLTKLQAIETLVAEIKDKTSVDIKSPETKMLIIKNKLDDIVARASARSFKVPETYEKIKELDQELAAAITNLSSEFDIVLEHYQLTLNYAYSSWIKKLKEIGFDIKNPAKIDFKKEQTAQERVQYIAAVTDSSKALGIEVCNAAAQAYDVIKSLYDPTLPAENGTVNYSRQKLAEKAEPWIACEGLIVALKNWKKQYEKEIVSSKRKVEESLTTLAAFKENGSFLQVLGERATAVAGEIEKAVALKSTLEQLETNVLKLPAIKEGTVEALNISSTVLSALHEELVAKEASIESLQPMEDGFWEKNVLLGEQLSVAIGNLSDFETLNLNQMLAALPSALSYIDSCVWTLTQYNAKNEILLNYPKAKAAIEALLKKKKNITTKDLPFSTEDSEEFLKLFFSESTRSFIFDEENLILTKRN